MLWGVSHNNTPLFRQAYEVGCCPKRALIVALRAVVFVRGLSGFVFEHCEIQCSSEPQYRHKSWSSRKVRRSDALEWRELPDEAVRVGEAGAPVRTEAIWTGVISIASGLFLGTGF